MLLILFEMVASGWRFRCTPRCLNSATFTCSLLPLRKRFFKITAALQYHSSHGRSEKSRRGSMADAANLNEELVHLRDYNSTESSHTVKEWLKHQSNGMLPTTSVGWFRAGVGFYNKKYFGPSIVCLRYALEMDHRNYNAQQVLGRAYLRVNKKDEALDALKKSVELHSSSDWQLLIEELDG